MRNGTADWSTKRIAIFAVAGLIVSALVGFWVGNTTSYGPKHLQVMTGHAMLHNTDNWLTSFDTDGPGDQLAFFANSVASDSGAGFQDHGVPSCLKVGKAVPVRVGYTPIRFPSDITMPVVQWVECLDE